MNWTSLIYLNHIKQLCVLARPEIMGGSQPLCDLNNLFGLPTEPVGLFTILDGNSIDKRLFVMLLDCFDISSDKERTQIEQLFVFFA